MASFGHPCKFQRVSRFGSVTAWHSSNGHQPNFAALNRGRHLCSAGQPSRCALAHISSCMPVCFFSCLFYLVPFNSCVVLLRFQNVSCRSVSVGFAEKTSVFGLVYVFMINAL